MSKANSFKPVLLLGNGINRIDNTYSWEQLMTELLDFCGLREAISVKGKPFPLLYEEIYLRWHEKDPLHNRELMLKKKIRSLLKKIRYNDLHHRVMELPVSDILTTNYDYNLESTLEGGYSSAPHIGPVKGSKFSLLRRRQAGDKVIWHIHGEASAPGSILLGYEQYAGYLQNIRGYAVDGVNYRHNGELLRFPPLTKRLLEGSTEPLTWIDYFFMRDVIILALTMDFVEMHLWWILDFRARLMTDPRYSFDNQIIYMYPSADQNWIKSRIDLLCACDVQCIQAPIERFNWKKMYQNVLTFIENANFGKEDIGHS